MTLWRFDMKLTLSNIKAIKNKNSNALEQRVCEYIIDEWDNYNDKKYIFVDVLKYGCQSGTVGFLTYYSDTMDFYNEYNEEINELLSNIMSEMGVYDFCDIFGDKWEKEDPLIRDYTNQNLLAWFGFEETLRNIGQNFETVQNYI